MDELSKNGIILGQEQRFDFEDRYFLQTARRVMKNDVVRGLVELITNADDSYCEIERNLLSTSGKISILIERRRKDKSSIIKVRDRAEGMILEEMVNKLRRVGGITSHFLENKGVKTRGLMGRGSKECVVFGILTFKCIKNNIFSEVILKKPATFIAVSKRPVTEFDRLELDIPKGDGTVVILEIEPHFKIPSHKFLVEHLPKYYSLRDIAVSPKRKLELIDEGNRRQRDNLIYAPRDGKTELDKPFTVPGYPNAEARLIVKKNKGKIEIDNSSPYWEGGILIQSSYAIHGITGFSRDIENNPYFEHYFGRLTCPYIDNLAIEYEMREKKRIPQTLENPSGIIDPLRTEGLSSNHPFTKALYAEAARQLKILLKRDEEAATKQIRVIENKKTTDRLRRLGNEASRFIKDRMESSDNIDDEYYLSPSDIQAGGMVVIPGGIKIPLGEERKFYVYVKPTSQQNSGHILASTNSKAIQLSSDTEGLIEKGDGVFYKSFSVKGIEYENSVKIKIVWGSIERYISAPVVKKEEMHPYVTDFSFEKSEYKVRKGKQKEIKILAKWPDFVHGWTECAIVSDNVEFVEIVGKKTRLRYTKFDDGTEMAIGKMKVFGKKIGGPTTIKTTLQRKEITTKVIVLPPKALGHNIEFKLVDEEALGEQRAVWSGDLLKINSRHKAIRRYSGLPPNYPGQDLIHFRLLLAELIADNVARRILELNAPKNAYDYENMDISGFYNKHHKYVNEFLEIAHKIQIPDSELLITKASSEIE